MMTQDKSTLSLSTLLILALTAVAPLAVATGFSNFERPRHIVLVAVSALALASWGVDVVRGRGPKIASPQTLALGGAFMAMVLASLAWSGQSIFGAISVLGWVGLGVVFVILVAPVGRRPDFLDWSTAVAAGTIGAGGMGLFEFFTENSIHPVWDTPGVTGGFDAIAFAAAYYLLCVPILAGALAISKGVRRWFMALGLFLGMVHLGLVVDGLMLGVLVAAMAASALLVWLLGSKVTLSPRLGLTAAAAILSLAVATAGLWAFERPDSETVAVDLPRVVSSTEFADEMASQERVGWWFFAPDRMEAPVDYRYRSYLNSVTRGLWDQEPVIGHGAGGWKLKQTDVVDDSDPVVRQIFDRYPTFSSPHSDYARVSVEQGGLGMLLFLLWLAGIATALLGGLRTTKNTGSESDARDAITSWALVTVLFAGLALMIFVPLLELVASGVIWMGAAAVGIGHGASRNPDSQWLSTYDASKSPIALRGILALMAFAAAVAMVIPAAQHGEAALERGHADNLMLQSSFGEAIDQYKAAHAAHPAHPEVLYNIAIAHYMLGDPQEGWEIMQEAVDLQPHDARFLVHSARLGLRTGRTDTALAQSEEAVRTAPNYVDAYEVYGAALQRRARYFSAADLFESFLERNPPVDIRGTFRVRYARILADQVEKPEEALDQYEKALDELPVGSERMLIHDRIEMLEARVEREELKEQGKPVPPELEAEMFEHDHDHDHDHGLPGLDDGPEPSFGPDHDHDHGPGEFGPDPLDHLDHH